MRAVRVAAWVALATFATAACSDGRGADDRTSAAPSTPTSPPTSPVTTSPPTATAPATAPTPTTTPTATPTTTATTTPTTNPTTSPAVDPAVELARRLEVAERGIRDTSLDAATRAAHGRDQQAAYRAAGSDRDLIARLPGLVADDVRVAVSFNLAARTAVLDHAATRPAVDPPPTLPAWTIVDPPPIDELLGHYREAQERTGVGWEWLAAIHLQETRMGRIVGLSSAGAVGPMQFLPSTWADCCEGDPTVARDAILGAATYLTQSGAPSDMAAAVYAYNPNDGYVGAVTAYAANLRAHPSAYVGYHAWEVYVATSAGTVRLPVGYSQDEPIDAAAWIAEHAADVAG